MYRHIMLVKLMFFNNYFRLRHTNLCFNISRIIKLQQVRKFNEKTEGTKAIFKLYYNFMFMPFVVNIIYGGHNEQFAPKSLSFNKHNQLWWVYFIL